MPAAAVRQGGQALFSVIWRKGHVGGRFTNLLRNPRTQTQRLFSLYVSTLNLTQDTETFRVRIQSNDTEKNFYGEGIYLGLIDAEM